MKKTILHMIKPLKNVEAYKNQSEHLFPFLNSQITM